MEWTRTEKSILCDIAVRATLDGDKKTLNDIMTYKDFYDAVVYAMLDGDSKTLHAMKELNREWFEIVTDDVKQTLTYYTIFGILV